MGLLTAGDLASMQADLLAVRADRAEGVVIRRGATTLASQTVRIARAGAGSHALRSDGGNTEQFSQRVVVLGAVGLDIQTGDRFNDVAGRLYEVDFVRPNRAAATMAEARVIQ